MISSISASFAYMGYFEEFPRQLYSQPRICIFQPPDSRVDDATWKTWYVASKKAIAEWESMLRQHDTSGKGNWHIDYAEITLDRIHLLDRNACDIEVHFIDVKRADAGGWYYPSTKKIEIIMVQMGYCGKKYNPEYGVTLDTYCRGDRLERASVMAAVLRHEIGHAFGLGHYVTDDPEIRKSWVDNPIGLPSIMTFMHRNEQQQKITLLDIDQVYKVHPTGFGESRNENIVFFDDYPKPNVVDTLDFSNTQTKLILVKRGETTYEKISGIVPSGSKTGYEVEILLIKPDKSYETNKAKVTENGYFEYPFRFDYSNPKGKYQIQISYFGQEIEKLEFEVTDKIKTTTIEKPKIKTANPIDYEKPATKKQTVNEEFQARYSTIMNSLNAFDKELVKIQTSIKKAEKLSKSDTSKIEFDKAAKLYNTTTELTLETITVLYDHKIEGFEGMVERDFDMFDLKVKKIDRDLEKIKQYVSNVTSSEKKQVEPQQQAEPQNIPEDKKQKQCFLFWCW